MFSKYGYLSTPSWKTLHKVVRSIKTLMLNKKSLNITVSEMRKFLKEKGFECKTGYTCLVAKCPFCCHDNLNKAQLHMYVNMTTGSYSCECIKYNGSWDSLQDVLTASQRKKMKPIITAETNGVNTEVKEAESLWSDVTPIKDGDEDLVAKLKQIHNMKPLTLDIMSKYDVHIQKISKSLMFPRYHHGNTLQGIRVLGSDVSLKGRPVFTDHHLPKLDCAGLFGWNLIHADDKHIVLTGSEADAMAVTQATRLNALALPRGISVLPQEVLPLLEQFERILLWFGNDLRSWEAAKQFAKKLNPRRCYFIRPKEKNPRPIEALEKQMNLNNIIKLAQPVSHKAIVSFRTLREEVLGELSHAEQVAGVKWSRFPLLNKLLKGHRRGELTVFTGPTGSGKTTFMSEYSLDLCSQGVNTLWGSFEIRNVRLAKMMLTQFSKVNLESQLDLFDFWADKFENLPLYFMTFHGQQNFKLVLEAMTHAVYVHDIEHVIVDNLQFMVGLSDRLASTDRFGLYDNIIASLRKFSTVNNCHVTVVIHPRKEKDTEELQTASIFGSAKAAQEADNILLLQDKRLTSLRGKKYIQVAKNRFDGDLGIVPLHFSKESLTMSSAAGGKTPVNKDGIKKQKILNSIDKVDQVLSDDDDDDDEDDD